jgi:hypothetical protein
MQKPRARRIVRNRCEYCGASLNAGIQWFTVHDGSRTQKSCRPCVEDHFARMDAEQRWQLDWLESVWALTPRQTGLGLGDDGEVSAQ